MIGWPGFIYKGLLYKYYMNSCYHVLDPKQQAIDQAAKIAASLERLGHIILTAMREAAHKVGLSPIQARILIHIGTHETSDSGMSALAAFFDVTVPTVSDAVNALVRKEVLVKQTSPEDARARILELTDKGRNVFRDLSSWSEPLEDALTGFSAREMEKTADSLLRLVSGLHARGRVGIARMCPFCTHYAQPTDGTRMAFCRLLAAPLSPADHRLDCPEFQVKA